MKKHVAGVLAFVALFASSCDSIADRWESLPILIAASTEAELETLTLFNDFFGAEVFVADPEGAPIIYGDIGGTERGQAVTQSSAGFIVSGIIHLDTTLDADRFEVQSVLAHELGHLLGHHHHSEAGLMRAISFFSSDAPELLEKFEGEFSSWFLSAYPEVVE